MEWSKYVMRVTWKSPVACFVFVLRLIFATQFIMIFQPNIILIFSIEMQPIYPISKQEVSMNRDCNFQAIDSRHCRCAGLTETPMCESRTGSREMRLTDHWCLHKTNNALLHIYSLIDHNQTNSSWVLTHAGTSRKPSASYIIDHLKTRLMPWCRPERKANNNYTFRARGRG